MEPLTYNIGGEADSEQDLLLFACSGCDITEPMWEELAASIAAERNLIPYPAAVLAERCRNGYAAAATHRERIVSYISLAPIVGCAGGAHSWEALTALAGAASSALPTVEVFAFTTSWTDPAWRRKRISLALRPPLLERWLRGNALGISGMAGLASPILARLGWQIQAWDGAPFVTSLVAVPERDFPAEAAAGWRPPAGLQLYQGPHISLDDGGHPWGEFSYCWVSSAVLTAQLERELAILLQGDLKRWRSAVVAAFEAPGSSHRLAFVT